MDRTLQLLLKLKDDASDELKKFSGNADKTGISLGKLGGIFASVFATKKIIDFGVDSVKAFADAEAQMAVFNTTLKSMGTVGEEARDALLRASDATIKLGFDNEETAVGMSKLFASTKDVNKAIEYNQLAMDIARGKGVDYNEALRSVNMALAGSTKELKLMGLEIDETATSTQVLGQLQQTYGGQAQAFAETTKGSMEILSGSWGELKEVIGETLAGAITPFIQELTAFVTDPRFIEFMKGLAFVVGTTLKIAIWAVKTVFDGWYQIITNTWELLKIVGSWLKDVFVKIFESVKQAIQAVIDTIQKLIEKFNELSIVKGAKSFVSNVKGGAGIVAETIKGWFGGGVDDGVIQNGKIISTNPDDFLIATKNPGALGGGGVTIVVNGDVSGQELVEKVKNAFMKELRFDTKFAV